MKKMKKSIMAIFLMGVMAIMMCACSIGDISPRVQAVKNGYLPEYSETITVGEAVDGFLADTKWKYFEADNGWEVIECNGKCSYMDEEVTITIQFVIEIDDSFRFYVLCIDDEEQSDLVAEAFWEKMYENAGAVFDDTETADETEDAEAVASDADDEYAIDVRDIETYWLDAELVTNDVLDTMSQDEVRTMLNALYAYHGYTFTTEYYQEYFAAMPWYFPLDYSMEDCEAEFNEYETANKDIIVAYEQEKGWR